MDSVRIAVIGVGGMGNNHCRSIKELPNLELVAICDIDEEIAAARAAEHDCRKFLHHRDLLDWGELDAVMVATPHFDHTPIAIDALQAGIHTLVEKPVGVHVADVQRMIDAHTDKSIKFAAMFNQRTRPVYKELKRLLDAGELGQLTRVSWTSTAWFRTQAYYDSGGWRATWKGEGGGVLFNQCPHQLDLLQWFVGMPERMRAVCKLGKFHDIEVEDEVSAYFEYANGATGAFYTTTGEWPGVNRLEIVGEMGTIILEGSDMRLLRNAESMLDHARNIPPGNPKPDIVDMTIAPRGQASNHRGILANFADSILHGVPLIAPAEEGIRSVELANAMLYSSLLDKTLELPLDAEAYAAKLKELQDASEAGVGRGARQAQKNPGIAATSVPEPEA